MSFETIRIGDLAGDLYRPASEPLACVLLLHGFASCRKEFRDLPQQLAGNGFLALTLDFRGHGDSEGARTHVTLHGHLDDARQAYRYLADTGKPIFVIGHSLGTAPSIRLAKAEPVAGLVLAAPVAQLRRQVQGVERAAYAIASTLVAGPLLRATGIHLYVPYKYGPKDIFHHPDAQKEAAELNFLARSITLNNYVYLVKEQDSVREAHGLAVPALVVVAEHDRIIPHADSKEVFDALAGDKTWIEIPGAGHSMFGDKPRHEASEAVIGWLKSKVPTQNAV